MAIYLALMLPSGSSSQPGDRPGPLAINKRIAEKLFLRTYDLELEQASDQRIWAYRRAAWTVDELPENIESIFKNQGEVGLRGLPGIGTRLAGLISRWLGEETSIGTTWDA